tara:strand:- start:1386 stop:1922 length:537 start_codon:yes stop_codon:yes gene_type:complete
MKLKRETLKQIIKEELEAVLDESQLLKKYTRGKEQEFLKKLKDMGKPPRKTFNALDPQMRSVLGQSLIDDYPGLIDISKDASKISLMLKKMMSTKRRMEAEQGYGQYAMPTGIIEKRDHGAFGIGYDVEFQWNEEADFKTRTISLAQVGDDIVFGGYRGKYSIDEAIRAIDSDTYDDY